MYAIISEEFLLEVMERERETRRQHRVERALRVSKLPLEKTMKRKRLPRKVDAHINVPAGRHFPGSLRKHPGVWASRQRQDASAMCYRPGTPSSRAVESSSAPGRGTSAKAGPRRTGTALSLGRPVRERGRSHCVRPRTIACTSPLLAGQGLPPASTGSLGRVLRHTCSQLAVLALRSAIQKAPAQFRRTLSPHGRSHRPMFNLLGCIRSRYYFNRVFLEFQSFPLKFVRQRIQMAFGNMVVMFHCNELVKHCKTLVIFP